MMTENLDIEFLEEYLEKYPDSLMFARLADAYLKSNKVDRAVELCEQGIRKHPYYITGHFVLGKCYLAKKQFEQAEKEFKRVLLFDPKYLAAHKYYGDVMKEIGWENTSTMSYKKILQIDPLDEVARSMAGEHILESEKTPETIESTFAEKGEDGDKSAVDEIEPMPVRPEEEDLLFEGDELKEEDLEQPEPEEQIDDRKAEEYSSLLDDIFKDEVVEEEEEKETPPTEAAQDEEEDIFKDLDETKTTVEQSPESYLTDLDFPEEPSEKTQDEPPAFDGIDPEPPSKQETQSMPFDFAPEPKEEEQPSPPPPKRPPEPEPKKTQKNKIVTPTLGEIYAAQGQYAKAIDVFETLLKKHPENEFYSKKITELQQKLAETKDAS